MKNRLARTTVLFVTLTAATALAGCAATRDRSRLVRDTDCADFSFQIYFAEDSAQVSRSARGVIAEAAQQLKICPAAAIEIVGLADYRGDAASNLTLSRRRGEAVALALARAGFPQPAFRVQAAGEAGAVTPAGDAEPLRRRAEVFVRYQR